MDWFTYRMSVQSVFLFEILYLYPDPDPDLDLWIENANDLSYHDPGGLVYDDPDPDPDPDRDEENFCGQENHRDIDDHDLDHDVCLPCDPCGCLHPWSWNCKDSTIINHETSVIGDLIGQFQSVW